jgi:predicted ABC-type sugar transport system permease subunit
MTRVSAISRQRKASLVKFSEYHFAKHGNRIFSRNRARSGGRSALLHRRGLVSGLCMGVAGGLAASQLSTAQARMEPTIVYDVLAAVVIGGTSL